jgi:hypothetical protein
MLPLHHRPKISIPPQSLQQTLSGLSSCLLCRRILRDEQRLPCCNISQALGKSEPLGTEFQAWAFKPFADHGCPDYSAASNLPFKSYMVTCYMAASSAFTSGCFLHSSFQTNYTRNLGYRTGVEPVLTAPQAVVLSDTLTIPSIHLF